MVIGGMAVNLHGLARMTMDLDIIIARDRDNRSAFYELMKTLGFRTKNMERSKKALTHASIPEDIKGLTFFREEHEIIDVFLDAPLDFEEVYKRREVFNADDVEISAVPYDVLIAMKRSSGRERDLSDIGYLERIRRLRST